MSDQIPRPRSNAELYPLIEERSELFKTFKLERQADLDVRADEISNVVTAEVQDVLGFLRDSGALLPIGAEDWQKPWFFGSAVRNHFLKKNGADVDKPSDIDIFISEDCLPGDMTPNSFIACLKQHPLVQSVPIREREAYPSINYQFKALLTNGTTLDFAMASDRQIQRKLKGDAPITSVILSETGEIMAHPFFLNHAMRLVYAHETVGEDRARTRFDQLKVGLPSLKWVGRLDNMPEAMEWHAERKRKQEELRLVIEEADRRINGLNPDGSKVMSNPSDGPELISALPNTSGSNRTALEVITGKKLEFGCKF